MKKETVILAVVIAFLVGFITGATVAILKGRKGVEGPPIAQTPQDLPETAPMPAPQGPSPMEVTGKVQASKGYSSKRPKESISLGGTGKPLFRLRPAPGGD